MIEPFQRKVKHSSGIYIWKGGGEHLSDAPFTVEGAFSCGFNSTASADSGASGRGNGEPKGE